LSERWRFGYGPDVVVLRNESWETPNPKVTVKPPGFIHGDV